MKGRSDFCLEGGCLSSGAISTMRVSVADGRLSGATSGPLWKLAQDELLIPAFHDHHTHLIGTHRPQRGPDLGSCPTRQECLAEVARWLASHPGTAPVIGEGWDESAWDDPRPLTRSDLDPVTRGRLVALRRVCGHIAVLNTPAWEVLAPAGGEADEVTGRVSESLALGIPQRWPATPKEDLEGARRGQASAYSQGVAAVDEMGRIETYQALRRLDEDGILRIRVEHYFPIAQLAELIDRGFTPERSLGKVRIAGLKGFLDGSIGGRTAAMSEAYRDESSAGTLLWETDRLERLVKEGVRAGFSIALHAIGLRAVEQALGVYERSAGERTPGTEIRIEHAEELDDRAIDRAAALGVILSMQPNFTARWQGPGGMYEQALGESRRFRLNRFGSAAKRTSLILGSDTMPFGPLYGLAGALAHPSREECLSAPLALRGYMPGGIGPGRPGELLAAGSRGDLVVLRIPGGDLAKSIREGTARVIWTAVGGRVCFCDPTAEAPPGVRGEAP